MTPVQWSYDPESDQLVARLPATEGRGDVELLRLDVRSLTAEDRQRLRYHRDPDKPQPPPGTKPATVR